MDRWVYDWTRCGDPAPEKCVLEACPVEVHDETLRDGLQCPSAKNPPLQAKRDFLHILVRMGVHSVDIGLPASGRHVREDTLRLAEEIARGSLPLEATCAARTVEADVRSIVEISQRAGIPICVALFIGSSAVRKFIEGWDLAFLQKATRECVSLAVSEGLPVVFVTEDTSRAFPRVIRDLYATAMECGANRICIADTVGCATTTVARNLVAFVRGLMAESGHEVRLDWHGHNDRGLGLMTALVALEAGVDRLHGSALGLGERVGNTPLDLLLVNLKLMGRWEGDLSPVSDYVEWTARWTGVQIPWNYPVFGRDAYRTSTGVHASAILKALDQGHDALADVVYSAVPPSWFDKSQIIEVGPMSGESNAIFWLKRHGFEPSQENIASVMRLAKASNQTLSDDELYGALAPPENA